MPGGKQMANTWQGNFPRENLMLDGYERMRSLAAADCIIPGHDPLVMQRYPAPEPSLQGIVARLD